MKTWVPREPTAKTVGPGVKITLIITPRLRCWAHGFDGFHSFGAPGEPDFPKNAPVSICIPRAQNHQLP